MFGTLRTLLALNVVLLHIFNIPNLGNSSVSVFFLLSGFLMTLIMKEKYNYNLSGFKFFWINRILRLYPIYYVIIILTVILLILFPEARTHPKSYLPNSFSEWIPNLTLIYPDFFPYRFTPRLSTPTWALTNELFFYFLISLGISKTPKRTILWLLISIGYFILTYHYFNLPKYRYGAIFAASLPFAMGSTLYWFIKKHPIKFNSIYPGIIIYMTFIANSILSSSFNSGFKEISIYINLLLGLIMVYYFFNLKLNFHFKKYDDYLGNYSYPIYISHYAALIIYQFTFGFGLIKNSFKLEFSALIPYFFVLISLSFLVVHFIDKKVVRLKKNLKPRVQNTTLNKKH